MHRCSVYMEWRVRFLVHYFFVISNTKILSTKKEIEVLKRSKSYISCTCSTVNVYQKNNESPLKGGTLNPKKKSFIPYGLVSSVFSSKILTCLSNQMTRDTSQIKELELSNLGQSFWNWSQASVNKMMKVTSYSSLLIETTSLSHGNKAVQ